jgi:putative phosphoribosyl transferase
MRFTDARAAGRALAEKLEAYSGCADATVLALASGGAAVGLEVSKRLRLPLDLVLLRRLLAPRGPGDPACVSSVAGSRFLDEEVAARADAGGDAAFGHFLSDALAEFDGRAGACRGARPAADLRGRTLLLVDDGIRTGSTVLAALRAIRSTQPARVVVAVPVAAPEALAAVGAAADELVYLAAPEPFVHVGRWYADFARPADEEIRAMLEESETQR